MAGFYLYELRRCQCGRPATVELRGSSNEAYGVFCDRCGKTKLAKREKDG